MIARAIAACACACAALAAPDARAWEAQTTNVGLAERAAEASALHDRLRAGLGYELGAYEGLRLEPGEAPALYGALGRLDPGQGVAPTEDGEHSALGWLAAGAAVAEMPAERGVHHAYDPWTGEGFSSREMPRGLRRAVHRVGARAAGARLLREGMPATRWIRHDDNPLSVDAFWDHYARAVSASAPAARERHAAAMLLAAGGVVHVVQDMASPARVRDDRAALLRRIGPDRIDVGSRFERLADLAYGRLGVPGPGRDLELRPSVEDYISAEDGSGLADRTAQRFMSHGTLPEPIDVTRETPPAVIEERLAESLQRPSPAPAGPLDLHRAEGDEGARLVDGEGVCVARYYLRDRELTWRIPDACALEQIRELLAEASAYGAGALDWLLRGAVSLEVRGDSIYASARGVGVRGAEITFFAEDGDGAREPFARAEGVDAGEGELLAGAEIPEGAARVVALVRGEDEHGEDLVAAGVH